jgi:predicted ArsR family transcriptional regulator
VGTADIAEEIGVARQTADKHLRTLVDDGDVETEKVGKSRIWWLSTDGRKRLAEMESD